MKRCTRCGQEKPPEAFYGDNSRADGLGPWCKECIRDHRSGRGYRQARRERYQRQTSYAGFPVPCSHRAQAISSATADRLDDPELRLLVERLAKRYCRVNREAREDLRQELWIAALSVPAEASAADVVQGIQRAARRLAKRSWRERRRLDVFLIDDPEKAQLIQGDTGLTPQAKESDSKPLASFREEIKSLWGL